MDYKKYNENLLKNTNLYSNNSMLRIGSLTLLYFEFMEAGNLFKARLKQDHTKQTVTFSITDKTIKFNKHEVPELVEWFNCNNSVEILAIKVLACERKPTLEPRSARRSLNRLSILKSLINV